ncbi:hypothetical protein Gotur_006796 [Gossypium turneri]
MYFIVPPDILSAPTVLQLDNTFILCITAATGIDLANAYSLDTVIASSPEKEVHDPWAFYLYAALLGQAFAYCKNSLLLPPVESRPCLSPSVANHPLGPIIDHRLGKLLPHQLANET